MNEPTPRHIVVMGVSGCGKSTVAKAVRDRTGWAFCEGDDFHPQANIDKMRQGIPLTDEDRRPWLAALTAWIREQEREGRSSVTTCSALRRRYRDTLRQGGAGVFFAHLDGPAEVLKERLEKRKDHFMPASLLQSQLDTLEPLEPDEDGIVVSIEEPAEEVAARILDAVE